MVAERGPVPKRSTERRRRNAPDPDEVQLVTAPLGDVEIPEPDEDWHEIAYNWFVGLEMSGQHRFYAQSDWDVAYLLAEQMSRLLQPVFVGFQEKWNREAEAMEKLPVMQRMPLKGGDLTALLKGFTDLLVTEGARRRMRVELDANPTPAEQQETAAQKATADARLRLMQGGKAG